MMKYRLFVITLFAGICFIDCSPGKKSVKQNRGIKVVGEDIAIDSNNFHKDGYTVTRMFDKKELEGKWIITTMRSLQNQAVEALTNVTLSIADSVFAGQAPCNSIAGDLILNGASVKFTNIIATKMACPVIEQETKFLDLLENSVRLIDLQENRLLLKTAEGNVIFECKKE